MTYLPSARWSGCPPHLSHFPLGRQRTEHNFVSPFILSSPSAIPEFHKKLSLLAFWMKCTGPSGVYHTTADKMMKQLDINFAATVNEECPGLAETGTSCCKKSYLSSKWRTVLYWALLGFHCFVFQSLGGLFGHGSKMLFEN